MNFSRRNFQVINSKWSRRHFFGLLPQCAFLHPPIDEKTSFRIHDPSKNLRRHSIIKALFQSSDTKYKRSFTYDIQCFWIKKFFSTIFLVIFSRYKNIKYHIYVNDRLYLLSELLNFFPSLIMYLSSNVFLPCFAQFLFMAFLNRKTWIGLKRKTFSIIWDFLSGWDDKYSKLSYLKLNLAIKFKDTFIEWNNCCTNSVKKFWW